MFLRHLFAAPGSKTKFSIYGEWVKVDRVYGDESDFSRKGRKERVDGDESGFNAEKQRGGEAENVLDRINKIDKIENRGRGLRDNNPDNPVNLVIKEPALRVTIPNANGNPQSRVYAYEVVVVGEDPKARLFKCVFAEGVNLAYGREPNRGITTLEIPNDQLPAGKKLTIGVRPLSSLGTKGKSIATTFRT